MSEEPLRIATGDLFSPEVESYLEVQEHLSRPMEDLPEQSWFARIFLSSWFYLAVAGGLGAFLAWAILEPFVNEKNMHMGGSSLLARILLFPTVAGFVGLFIGAGEGIMCRNTGRAVKSGAIGLGVAFLGAVIAVIPTGIVFAFVSLTVAGMVGVNPDKMTEDMIRGPALLVLMGGRALAWCIISLPSGLGQGVALGERKLILNGILGGVLGGFIGGFMFDPIAIVFKNAGSGSLSRMFGFMVIGLMVGLFIGLVENWTKTAWLLMRKGPLAGKQFVIFRETMVVGSSPKADIYLFKDDAIEPKHALIHNRGGRFELEDCNSRDGTYVNGMPVKRHILMDNDQIVMGKTVLEFSIKQQR